MVIFGVEVGVVDEVDVVVNYIFCSESGIIGLVSFWRVEGMFIIIVVIIGMFVLICEGRD